MSHSPHRSRGDILALLIARLGIAGLAPKGPGTAGSILAALLAPWCFMPLPFSARVVLLIAVFVGGAWAAGRSEEVLGRKDPGEVVVDELLGQWLTYLPFAALTPVQLVLGLVFFRIFDIAKPWPVKDSENWLPGGMGVMIDDAVAGLYALVALWAVLHLIG